MLSSEATDGLGSTPPEVSVVVPLYWSAATIEQLVERVCSVLEERGITHEIVVVDDSSSDAAQAISDKLAAQHAAEAKTRQEIMDHPAVREALQTFSGSRVVEVITGLENGETFEKTVHPVEYVYDMDGGIAYDDAGNVTLKAADHVDERLY